MQVKLTISIQCLLDHHPKEGLCYSCPKTLLVITKNIH